MQCWQRQTYDRQSLFDLQFIDARKQPFQFRQCAWVAGAFQFEPLRGTGFVTAGREQQAVDQRNGTKRVPNSNRNAFNKFFNQPMRVIDMRLRRFTDHFDNALRVGFHLVCAGLR